MEDLILPDKLVREPTTFPLLDGTNYASWKRSMRILFIRMSLLDVIDIDKPVDADYRWERADSWAFSEIYFRSGPEPQQNLTDDMSAAQAWRVLKELYQSSSLGNIFRLTAEFTSLRQKPGQPSIQFINSVLSAAAELRYLGENISENKVKWQILGNLHSDFNGLVTTLSNIDSVAAPLDIKAVRESIMREERQISLNKERLEALPRSEKRVQPEVVFKTSEKKEERNCTDCGGNSHTQERCWETHPNLRPSWFRLRSSSTKENTRNKDRRHDSRNKGRSSKRSSYKQDKYRVKKDHQKKSSRRSSKHKKYSSSESSSSSSSSSSEDERPKKRKSSDVHKAKLIIGDPCVPRETPYVDHSCMARDGENATPSGKWMLDSGASNHYTSDKSCFVTFELISPIRIETASEIIYGQGRGEIILTLNCGTIRIPDVIYVPKLVKDTNLLSVGQLESRGIEFRFKNGKCYMWKQGSLWAVAPRVNNVYYLELIEHAAMMKQMVSFPTTIERPSSKRNDIQQPNIWHRRMGHLNKKYMSILRKLADGIEYGEQPKNKFDCEDCVKANQKKKISRFPIRQPQEVLDIIYADLCGPMQENDFWGHRYFALFVCGKSRYKWLYLLFKQDDVAKTFREWKAWAERHFFRSVKILHTDGGGEFAGNEFQAYLKEQGIEHVTTPAYSPEMNGSVEVWNRVIVESASAMLHTSNLKISFWGQAALCATYLLNRSPTKGLSLKKTPFEALYGTRPYLGHIRTWGCRGYAHIKKESKKRKKWDSHSRECLLMGFYESENVYKLYDIEANSLIKIRDVIFFKEVLGHDNLTRGSLPLTKNILGEDIHKPDDTDDTTDLPTEQVQPDAEQTETLVANFIRLLQENIAALSVEKTVLPIEPASPFLSYTFKLPAGYKTAMKTPQAPKWKEACDAEFSALIKLNTWELVERRPGMVIIGNKWVFDIKTTTEILPIGVPPKIERFKARLVARGDSQTKGINFDEVYAPVVRFVSLRILLHIAACQNYEIEQGDFANAFLNGTLDDVNIYMVQPEGYYDKEKPNHVCHLKKSLYGLRQAARVWYKCLDKTISEYGLERVASDQAIWKDNDVCIIAHVDDIILVAPEYKLKGLKQHLGQKYRYKDLGPVTRYTGFIITRDRENRRLFIDQAPYVHDLLEEFKLSNCAPASTPMEPKATWEPADDDEYLDPKGVKVYQRAIGKLMYLMLGSRPDISYPVTKLAQSASKPTQRHWTGVLRIMRYLRSHDSVTLTLGNQRPPIILEPQPRLLGYFDASLMDCAQSRKSTGAYVFFLDGSCISWNTKKQGLVALSSTEAEFISGTEAAKELSWLIGFLEGINSDVPDPVLLGDNQGALALAKNNDFRAQTKHIHARERYIAHMVQEGLCFLKYVPTRDMIADALTKPLSREPFERHAMSMGLKFNNQNTTSCNKCMATFRTRNTLYTHLRKEEHYANNDLPDCAMLANSLEFDE